MFPNSDHQGQFYTFSLPTDQRTLIPSSFSTACFHLPNPAVLRHCLMVSMRSVYLCLVTEVWTSNHIRANGAEGWQSLEGITIILDLISLKQQDVKIRRVLPVLEITSVLFHRRPMQEVLHCMRLCGHDGVRRRVIEVGLSAEQQDVIVRRKSDADGSSHCL